ncbi:MAG: hypothetical protein GY719_28945 [bacterium]|nr:hypothetical protein [bacterium]
MNQLPEASAERWDRQLALAGRACILLLLIAACVLQLRTPVVGWDTDLWYHLSHGRYLYDSGEIPSSTYFSFLTPERPFLDYYWGFQALIYPLFLGTGYHGLIVLRTLLYGATMTLVALLLLRGGRRASPALAVAAGIFSLELLVIADRSLLTRPHTISYLAIAAFVYVLECRRSWSLVLPFVAVVWVNAHGVEYPVLVLICLAYLVDVYARRWRSRREETPRDLRTLTALGLSLAAIFATPHGSRLLAVPFTSTDVATYYIAELEQLTLTDLLMFEISADGIPHETAFNLLLAAAAVAAIGLLARRRARLCHLLLLAGSLGLLWRGERFRIELALLTLPLLSAALARWSGSWKAPRRGRSTALACLGIAVLGGLSLPLMIPGKDWAYPLAGVRVPEGTTRFLNGLQASGAVMNHTNYGGYLIWALEPRYKIYMDMEVPFAFSDTDMFRGSGFFADPTLMTGVLAQYRPAFIIAHLDIRDFPERIRAHPEYAPVFFDNVSVLYADRSRFPHLAALEHVDAYALQDRHLPEVTSEAAAKMLRELHAVLEIVPNVDAANQAAAILYNRQGEYARARGHAEAIIASSPTIPQGHLMKGDALSGLGQIDEALRSYRRAARLAEDEEEERQAHRSLAIAYSRNGESRKSYRSLLKAMGRFDIRASFLELQNLASLALQSGDLEMALVTYRFARLKVPAEETEWQHRIDAAIADLEARSR